jgi:hypothetical protein
VIMNVHPAWWADRDALGRVGSAAATQGQSFGAAACCWVLSEEDQIQKRRIEYMQQPWWVGLSPSATSSR